MGNQSKFDAFLQVGVSCKVKMPGQEARAQQEVREGQAERVAGERKRRWERNVNRGIR